MKIMAEVYKVDEKRNVWWAFPVIGHERRYDYRVVMEKLPGHEGVAPNKFVEVTYHDDEHYWGLDRVIGGDEEKDLHETLDEVVSILNEGRSYVRGAFGFQRSTTAEQWNERERARRARNAKEAAS